MSHASAALLGSPSLSSPPPASTVASPHQIQWESLRKKSRLLETQLYKKLQEFSNVQTAIMNEGRGGKSNARAARAGVEFDTIRATAGASSSVSAGISTAASPLLQYETCSTELTDLLRSFNDINDGLAKLLADIPSLNTDANAYIVQKSRTSAHESALEFKRTKQNIQAALARSELMAGGRERRDADQSMKGRTEQLLREEKSLSHSLRLTDDVIASAVAARDSLVSQGNVFQGVGQKLNRLGQTFPVVGQLMNRINCKHQRDMIVLACVIAMCMIFTFLYVMSKA